MYGGKLDDAGMWLQDKFIKYHLCRGMKLQPNVYDALEVDDALAYWLIDQTYRKKEQEDFEMKQSKQRSKSK